MQVPESFQDKIFGYIDAIAEKLGVAAEFVFAALVKQQIVKGISDLVIWIAFLIIFFIFLRLTIKYSKGADLDDYEPNASAVFMTVFGFLSIILFLILTISLANYGPDYIGRIINPEYYALKEIIEAVK